MLLLGDGGERLGHVESRDRGSRVGKRAGFDRNTCGGAGKQLLLPRDGAFTGMEHDRLVLLEVGGHETLGAGERLLARVIVRNAVTVRVRDLDVIAEDPVVADAEGSDPGAFALARLQRREIGPGGAPGGAEAVQVRVCTGTDGTTVARARREVVAEQRSE